MEDRLVQLLKSEGINPTRFAERIGVQRSSMSHILSGRNKPSYDFIVKILESFPALNPDWLLRGKGLMYKNDIPIQPSLFDNLKPGSAGSSKKTSDASIAGSNDLEDQTSYIRLPKPSVVTGNEVESREIERITKIEKIVIFYTDKTFSDYLPNT
jgi:transcriptional regulator with XRE-family HTH domain